MDVRLSLTEDEAAALTEFAAVIHRAPDDVATDAVRTWLDRRRELSAHVDRILTDDAELLRRLADT